MGKKNRQSIVALALITAICLAGDAMLYIVLPIHWSGVALNSLIEVGVLLSINRFVRLPLNPVSNRFFIQEVVFPNWNYPGCFSIGNHDNWLRISK